MIKNILLTFVLILSLTITLEAQQAVKQKNPNNANSAQNVLDKQEKLERIVKKLSNTMNGMETQSRAMAPLQWESAPGQTIQAATSATVDAAIISVTYPSDQTVLCNATFEPVLAIVNNGVQTISTVQINTYINNSTTPSYSNIYGGTVTAGQSVNLTLVPHIIPENALTSVKFEITQVNGGQDPNTTNNTKTVSLIAYSVRNLPYTQNFETNQLDGISIYNWDNDDFTWGRYTGASAYGVGNASVYFDNYGVSTATGWNAPIGTEDWLILPPMNLTTAVSPSLKFDMAYEGLIYQGQYYSDEFAILVSTDCFLNYNILFYDYTYVLSCQAGAAAFANGQFIPTASDWCQKTYDLSAYIGQPNVSIAFINLADGTNNVFIDNINISSVCNMTASTSNLTNVTCYGDNTGAMTAVVNDGIAPYTYLWSNTQTTATISGLTAGTYTVTVTDANGCTATTSNAITQPQAAMTATVTNVVATGCASNSGSFTVNVNGGLSPYTFIASTGTQTSNVFSNLAVGAYQVTITDANGCSIYTTGTVNSTAAISLLVSNTAVSCAGNDGTATATASSGTAPYTYLWSNGETTANMNSLAEGTYSVTVTDAAGCQSVGSTTVANGCTSCAINITLTATDESCFAANNGAIEVVPTTGTAPYTYDWSTANLTGANPINVPAGTHTVTVTDANGCTATQATIVLPGTVMVVNVSIQNNGSAALATPQHGTAPYTYLWSDGSTASSILPTTSGMYSVTVTDANGCTASSAVVNLIVGVNKIEALSNFAVYPNPNTGFFTVNVELTTMQDFQIMLTDVLGRQIQLQNFNASEITQSIDLSNMPNGIYFLTVQTAEGRMTEKVVKY